MILLFPSILYQDFLLLFGIYNFDSLLIANLGRVALFGYSISFIVKLFYVFLLVTCITAVFIIGGEFDVGIIYKVVANWNDFSKMASSKNELIVMGVTFALFFLMLGIALGVNYLRERGKFYYLPLTTKKTGMKKKTIAWIIAYTVYLVIAIALRPDWPYNSMSKNVLFKFVMAPWNDPLANMGGSNPVLSTFSFGANADSLNKVDVTDFGFLNRTEHSEIRNVLWFNFESARADIYPFDYDSAFAQRLTDQARQAKNITPFMDNFVEECAVVTEASTASTYTIKSIMAMQCSMYPYPSDFVSEDERNYYKTCLPERLKNNGFDVMFMEPSETGWERFDKVLRKTGLSVYAKEEIDKEFEGEVPYEKINYFGYTDQVMLDRMFSWMDKRAANNTPFYLTSLTNTNHHPWTTPKEWEKKEFAHPDSHQTNDYFNSVSYTDSMIREVVEFLKQSGLSKSTLLVLNGDHGMALGDQGVFGATNALAVSYRVPMFLWTENEKWNPILRNRTIDGDRITLDIVPTILDMLNEDYSPETRFNYDYEGDSLLHPFVPKPRFGFSNPGASSIQVRENGFKYATEPSGATKVYDLKNDPEEVHELDLRTYQKGKFAGWFKRAQMLINEKITFLKKAYE
ncbi:hypothetical protein HK103_005156 [Boothiomyces macroporosus]|uniref:Sulfatase N-terminal domain-containing protein n=1 Tax=Boothiomyces macroporosus TaxID=261099 RepID=A0AAD5UG80_9FUNG|nr:hypothetical protein HK103_005156 [Boothiomyces macroporosus]